MSKEDLEEILSGVLYGMEDCAAWSTYAGISMAEENELKDIYKPEPGDVTIIKPELLCAMDDANVKLFGGIASEARNTMHSLCNINGLQLEEFFFDGDDDDEDEEEEVLRCEPYQKEKLAEMGLNVTDEEEDLDAMYERDKENGIIEFKGIPKDAPSDAKYWLMAYEATVELCNADLLIRLYAYKMLMEDKDIDDIIIDERKYLNHWNESIVLCARFLHLLQTKMQFLHQELEELKVKMNPESLAFVRDKGFYWFF